MKWCWSLQVKQMSQLDAEGMLQRYGSLFSASLPDMATLSRQSSLAGEWTVVNRSNALFTRADPQLLFTPS